MKFREFDALTRRYLLPHLPGFNCGRGVLFTQPVQHLLRGCCFEGSGFNPDRFYVWAFILPLYVPTDHLYLQFGDRLRGPEGEGWAFNRDDPGSTMADVLASIKEQGLPLIASAQTPAEMAVKAPLLSGRDDDSLTVETVAYSLILAQKHEAAFQALDRLDAICEMYLPTAPYLAETLRRSQMVRECLGRDPEQAVNLLGQWGTQTRAALRLPPEISA